MGTVDLVCEYPDSFPGSLDVNLAFVASAAFGYLVWGT